MKKALKDVWEAMKEVFKYAIALMALGYGMVKVAEKLRNLIKYRDGEIKIEDV